MTQVAQPRTETGKMAALPDSLYWDNVRVRLLANSERSGDCLLWTGKITYSGYGHITIRRQKDNAHRAAYRAWVGEIPAGLEIDHLCNVRNCIEPSHLEAVTHAENLRRIYARQTACGNGHDLAANAYVSSRGRRVCRVCKRAANRAWRASRKEQGR